MGGDGAGKGGAGDGRMGQWWEGGWGAGVMVIRLDHFLSVLHRLFII